MVVMKTKITRLIILKVRRLEELANFFTLKLALQISIIRITKFLCEELQEFEMAYLNSRMVDIYNQLSHLHFCFNIFSSRIQTNQANRLLLPFFTSKCPRPWQGQSQRRGHRVKAELL